MTDTICTSTSTARTSTASTHPATITTRITSAPRRTTTAGTTCTTRATPRTSTATTRTSSAPTESRTPRGNTAHRPAPAPNGAQNRPSTTAHPLLKIDCVLLLVQAPLLPVLKPLPPALAARRLTARTGPHRPAWAAQEINFRGGKSRRQIPPVIFHLNFLFVTMQCNLLSAT